jgi:uncharacterized membrane protein
MAYLFISLIIFVLLIATLKKWTKCYPYLLYAAGLAGVWQTTLLGAGLVGSDIHGEFYFATQAIDGWNSFASLSNTSLLNIVVPFLMKFIGPLIVFKWVLPAVFAFVPVILYFAFKKQMSASAAMISALFFIIVPSYSLEIAGIAKSQIAEVFLALAVLILVTDLKSIIKVGLLIPVVLLCLMFHYTAGIILLGYLGGIVFIGAIGKFIRIKSFDFRWRYLLVFLFVLPMSFLYFSIAGGGILIKTIETVALWAQQNITPDNTKPTIVDDPDSHTVTGPAVGISASGQLSGSYLNRQPAMVRAGIGLDFFQVSLSGKVFRILQYLTQLLILLGAVWIIFKSKFKPEFVAGIVTALLMLGLCIFFPNFAMIANMSRFYHLSLFFLAPCLVFGLRWFDERIA